MSGAVEDLWAFSPYDLLKRAFNIANELGEPQKTREQLISFLKSVPAEQFGKFAASESTVLPLIPFGPIVESRLNLQNIFA